MQQVYLYMTFDIIGDIHGYADRLKTLLSSLGYAESGGAFGHPEAKRKAIFVGDFVDRGPQIPEALSIVKGMVEAGAGMATMGNHELNAICFHTRKPGEEHRWMRTRNDRHIAQHIETLYQFRNNRDMWEEYLGWFFTLPLFLDLPNIRVVHAAWDPESIHTIRPLTAAGNRPTRELLVAGTLRGTPEFRAIQNLLKGIEIDVPSAGPFIDKDGNLRNEMRVRWWLNAGGKTMAEISLSRSDDMENIAIPDAIKARIPGYNGTKPVFFGHYWLEEEKPKILAPRVACLDYSVANGGSLAAYTWRGETELCNDHFTVA